MVGTTSVTILEDTFVLTGGWFHLPISIDEFMLHQFGAVCGEDIFIFIFENVVSIKPLHSDGTQFRFRSLGPASSSSCSHH